VFTPALVPTTLFGYAPDLRWIDVVSQSPRVVCDRYFVTPNRTAQPRTRSEVELIE
jgi:hypothetical protein